MTYDARETSQDLGDPVELYLFETNSAVWRYTSSDVAYTYDAQEFVPANLKRSELVSVQELNKNNLSIETARNFPVAQLFQVSPPGEVIAITILRGHRGDADNEFVAYWTGRVMSCEWAGVSAQLYTESSSTSVRRPGLTRRYCAECPHALYGDACGVNKADYRHIGVVSSISGSTVAVAGVDAEDDGYYNGGYIYWFNGSYGNYQFIESHAGEYLTMMFPATGLSSGMIVEVYPGCARVLSECASKFNNELNYGGWPFMPDLLPFNGTNVF